MKFKAYTSLELLFSLGLSAPIIAVIIKLILTLSSADQQLTAQYTTIKVLSKSVQHLSSHFARVDTYPINIPPRIHTQGLIYFTDNTLNPISESSKPPKQGSGALTTIAITPNSIYKVIKSEANGIELKFEACLSHSSNEHTTNKKTFIGVSVDGYFELTGTVQSLPGRSDCKNFSLNNNLKSMIIYPNQSYQPLNLKLLLPVHSYSTLYLDQTDQLRYLGHSGLNNTENQPLVAGIESLGFKLKESAGLFELESSIEPKFGKIQTISFVNHLARVDKFTLFSVLR